MSTNIIARIATILVATLHFAQPGQAAGDAAAGEFIGYSCLGCHGIEGYRNAYPSYRVPKLGGQKAGYLVIALQGYRDGTRDHPTMQAQAASMSNQDIEDVAAYLAGIGGDTVAAGGRKIDIAKDPLAGIAMACEACHGKNGISVNAVWPTLAGQYEDYLLQALNKYRDDTRSEPVMAAQAKLIAEEDVAILAEYYASLDGLETTLPD